MEYIINKFIEQVVEALKDGNEQREYKEKPLLNIPFTVSVLCQHLQDKEYISFIEDISKYDYSLIYEDSDGYYEFCKLTVHLYTEEKDADYNGYDLCCQNYVDYTYSIIFSYDERYWGYCQCEPDYKDYREDKGCCGHGCDWSAPAFNIIKEIPLGYSSWNGDEHDFWEFEDSFYKLDKELAEEKAKRDKENRIEYIEKQMKNLEEELNKLKGE